MIVFRSKLMFILFEFSQKIIKCFRQVNSIQLNVNLCLILTWLIMMTSDFVVGKVRFHVLFFVLLNFEMKLVAQIFVRNVGLWWDLQCRLSIEFYMVCSFESWTTMKLFFVEDFGFEHRLWIYSGRRGVHCWVCDQTARELQSSIRQAIVEHLSVLTVTSKNIFSFRNPFFFVDLVRQRISKTCFAFYSFTSIASVRIWFFSNWIYIFVFWKFRRAREILLSEFDGYACLQQDFLGDEQRIERFLRLVPDESRQTLRDIFGELSTSAERWSAFKQHVESIISSSKVTFLVLFKLKENKFFEFSLVKCLI